jgi:hypothetical protein
MLQDSTRIKQKTRHGCLTAWLVLIIIFNIVVIIIAVPKGSPSAPDIFPWWQALIIIAFNLFNIVCAFALFMWKKWGFWGFCAGSVAAFIANIVLGELVILALVGMVAEIFILYLVLNIGQDNKGWPQLE